MFSFDVVDYETMMNKCPSIAELYGEFEMPLFGMAVQLDGTAVWFCFACCGQMGVL